MTVLSIHEIGTGRSWKVWPEPETIPPGVIRETANYVFELQGVRGAGQADLLIDDEMLEALRPRHPAEGRWYWSPGFHAGTVEAELRLPGSGTRRFEVVTDPDLRKLTREDFDVMLREILEDTFALFALSAFRKSIARGIGGRAPAIARLEFLRSRIDQLERAAHEIARRPRRLLVAEEAPIMYHRAVRATGHEILRSFRSGRILRETRRPPRLPPTLKGFLPEKIRLRQQRSSLDLPEHRQMAACLRSWASWLTAAAGLLARPSRPEDLEVRRAADAWSARCRRLSRRLRQLCNLPPFAEAGDAPPRLLLSALFRNDPPYRRFFRLYQDMNLGIAAVFGDFLAMPLARTYELYELWCFLRLLRAAADEFGPTGLDLQDLFVTDAAGGVTVSAIAVTVPVGSSWTICFQRQYREFWLEPGRRGSYSRTMRPDLVMMQDPGTEPANARLIVLDAKYRIEEGLNGALSSIHTYRDALVREIGTGTVEGIVTAAYLLTPHMPALGARATYRDSPMPARLFHPEYRHSFRFGAVTLRPGMSANDLREALRIIVADATA